jgi:hypothetical protein
MTLSRDLSSSTFYSPSRALANPCPDIGTMRFQRFAGALWTTFTVPRIPSRHSACAALGILRIAMIGKTPFNTQ